MRYKVQHDVRRKDSIGPWEVAEKVIEADNKLSAIRAHQARLEAFGYQTAGGTATKDGDGR